MSEIDPKLQKYYCKTCKRTMDDKQFYTSHRLDKYPNFGRFDECKQCLTRHVDIWDPETYLWILEEADVPYVEECWAKLLNKYATEGKKCTAVAIMGRYLSQMRLVQHRKDRWKDTERIAEEARRKREESMKAGGYSGEQIVKELDKGQLPTRPAEGANSAAMQELASQPIDFTSPDYFINDLTEDDKKMLSIKWGRAYKPYEWVQLEQFYTDMMNSYDIQTPSHIDYLKLICKTSLKCHQLLDISDLDGYQKMSKVYDSLMKSAKFTAAQDKAENGEYLNTIGELVQICEREGFIPRFYVSKPQDKVDETLSDFRQYTYDLVTQEMNLGNMIEGALKALQREAEREEDEDIDESEIEYQLRDQDFIEFADAEEEGYEIDAELTNAKKAVGR